jgi:hypothetical protein
MCVTAVIALAAIATVASGVGAAASMGAAKGAARNAAYQAKMEQKQIAEQKQSAQLQALRQEVGRVNEFAAVRSSALASIGSSGLSENISWAQGIAPEDTRQLGQDVGAIRLNLFQAESSLADRVGVSEYGAKVAKFNAGMQKLSAVSGFLKDSANAASFYATNTPGFSGGGTTPAAAGGSGIYTKSQLLSRQY